MAIAIKFDKQRAQQLLDTLANGMPIEPPAEGWTGNDMLAVAGACFFGATSQGPASFWLRDLPENLHQEYREAAEETFMNDLRAAVEFYSHLSMMVQDKTYDDSFAPCSLALVTQEGDIKSTVLPIKGFKDHDDVI